MVEQEDQIEEVEGTGNEVLLGSIGNPIVEKGKEGIDENHEHMEDETEEEQQRSVDASVELDDTDVSSGFVIENIS
ncbi:unnamed protein product [Arabis nemorensis]|uniref:Uncharacterized protein n=1 Tax=Arabis nemorensis TaxID=586526 RepID=A0A565BAW2_9BRAS|nr:unnamed protein product [Arabis nemorensis]